MLQERQVSGLAVAQLPVADEVAEAKWACEQQDGRIADVKNAWGDQRLEVFGDLDGHRQ